MAPTSAAPSDELSDKRKADTHDASISPPPTKRKIQSTVSKNTVASFFTPTSQKPKDKVVWTERAPAGETVTSLLATKFVPPGQEESKLRTASKSQKIACFDLDSTLISTASGKKHAEGAHDWKWFDASVPTKLKALHDGGYRLAIFSNQGGLTLHPDPGSKSPANNRVSEFKQKCAAIVTQLDLPILVYGAAGKDVFRKPCIGMWMAMCEDLGLDDASIDKEHSIFVGDAGGRTAVVAGGGSGGGRSRSIPKDFSCSDRNFAANVGIPYQTPEEYFLNEAPREWVRGFDLAHHTFGNDEAPFPLATPAEKEVVLFCGPPGAGKSTFFAKALQPLGYGRVNQDALKTKERCIKAATEFLQEGSSVAIDNTNPDPATRALWVGLAEKNKVPIRCIWFKTPPAICEHNDTVRSMNNSMNPEQRQALPRIAFNGFTSRFKEPKISEGFSEIVEVEFQFRGTKEDYDIWGRYWL